MKEAYKKIYPLTKQILHVIVAKHMFPATLIESKPLTGGLFNITNLLELSDDRKVVLRISPDDSKLFSYERHLMLAEKWASELCDKQEIPVPKVIAVDDSLELIDRPFMLSAYIPAKSLPKINVPIEKKAECYVEAGHAIRRMHDITGRKFGRLALQVKADGFNTWSEAILYEIEEWKKAAVPVHLLPDNMYTEIDSLFRVHIKLLNKIVIPHLVHGDLWSGNILANVEDGICRFRALIDADHSLFGDPEFDFSGGMVNEAFAEGYGRRLKSYKEDEESFIRRKLYLLLHSMKQCYVFQHLHNDTENSQRQRAYIERILQEFA